MKSTFKKFKRNFNLAIIAMVLMFIGCAKDEIVFEEDFKVVPLTSSTIQAEDYDNQSGIRIVDGSKVGSINDGEWIRFDDFDFDGAKSVSVIASSATNGGTIEFRAGSPTSDLLGTVSVSGTGGWFIFQTFTGSINGSSNNSDLYLVFKGDSDFLFDVDSFTFSVSDVNSNNPNLALGKTAEQSSTAASGEASRAVDGNTSGDYRQNSVTHTSYTNQPWWQVRLGDDYEIGQIVIWNRTDCCTTRLINFDVFVYNDAGSLVFKSTILDSPSPSVTINTGGVTGSRVRVKLKGTNYLSLAEVQVFGEGDDIDENLDRTTIPAKIEAEDFNEQSGTQNESTQDSGGGQNVGWINTGDFLEYEVNVPNSGQYTIDFRVSSRDAGVKFDIYQGSSKIGDVSSSATGGFQTWTTVTQTVSLNSGNQTIKLIATGSGWNINWLEFKSGGNETESGNRTTIPAKIEAEDFNEQSGTLSQTTQDSGGGQNVGWIDSGDFLEYEVNVPNSGQYTIDFRVASVSTVKFDIYQGSSKIGDVSSDATGGFQTWKTVTQTVSLNSGNQTIKLIATGSGWNINWLEFKSGSIAPPPTPTPPSGSLYPGEVLGLSEQDWKLNGFIGSPGANASYEDDVLDAANKNFSNYEDDNYFYTDGEWAFFKCYRGLGSSTNSKNPRVELRELSEGSDNYTWDGNSGVHTMEYKVRVDRLPKSTSGSDGVVCFGQIHGPNDTTDDVLRVQFRGSPNQTSGDVQLKISGYVTEKQGGSQSFDGYKLGTEYTVKIEYSNKEVNVWIDGVNRLDKEMDISSKGWDWKGNYFKVGTYLQSVQDGSFDGSYGLVRIKDLSVNHTN